MAAPVLVPLNCLKCQAALPAKPDEIAWICSQCGQGHLLDENKPAGLAPLEIHFSQSLKQNQTGRPFWVVEGNVSLTRTMFKGNEGRDSVRFWSQPRMFFVPAFESTLAELVNYGKFLVKNPPALQPGVPTPFLPVKLSLQDVHPMAEFIVLGVEAERRDMLKEIVFDIQLAEPSLWILP